MHTLPENYQKNVDILKENIKRGMTQKQACDAIDGLERQFTSAGLYNETEKQFIDEMRNVAGIKTIKAVDLMQSIGINVTNIK